MHGSGQQPSSDACKTAYRSDQAEQCAKHSVKVTVKAFFGTYMVTNAVPVNGVGDQQVVGGVVESEGPEGLCWQGKREGDSVVVAC